MGRKHPQHPRPTKVQRLPADQDSWQDSAITQHVQYNMDTLFSHFIRVESLFMISSMQVK